MSADQPPRRHPPAHQAAEQPADQSARPPGRPPARRDDLPAVPDRAAEDSPEAWGERPEGDDDERFLRERPPHW